MKNDFFLSCGHCWIFQICWHTKCSTLIASSFRIWNSSAGIPLPPLALFIIMFPKAHLLFFGTLHSDGYTFPFLLCLSLLFFSQLFVRPPQINIFPFCAFLLLFAILWNSAFRWIYLSFSPLPFTSLLFSAICKASSDNHFAFLHFFFLVWFLSPPSVQCYEPPSIVFQVLCLPDLIPWIHMSLPLYNHKGFDLGDTWMT